MMATSNAGALCETAVPVKTAGLAPEVFISIEGA